VQISIDDGQAAGYGIVRGIQKPGEMPWDAMVEFAFRFDPKKYYVWVEPTRGAFSGEPLPSAAKVVSVANLLMKAVVLRGEKTDEGHLIEAVTLPWLQIVAELSKDPKRAHEIPPYKWEEIIAGAYKRAGFEEVILTPRSGDFGRDVIAVKRGLGSIRVIDQVKAYKPGHLVTADDVRALYGVLMADGASKGFLTTTSDFAPRLRDDLLLKPLFPSRLELINGQALLKNLDQLARTKER
jgi:restriction system protein